MAERLSSEAILPCLLDRLCDDEPQKTHESSYRQNLTLTAFRRSVLRELGWLLNTPCHTEDEIIQDYPEVRSSVVNFGKPDLTGKTATNLKPRELEQHIAEAIRRFEPRILSHSLSVRVIPHVNKAMPNLIGFEIRGLLWANPLPEQFQLQTEIDLETGKCKT